MIRFSLRKRVLFWVVAINVAVVSAEFALLARGLSRDKEESAREYGWELVSLVRNAIVSDGLNAARILQWPSWHQFADAMVCDRNLFETELGRVVPRGVALNPLGARLRRTDFDEQDVYRAMLAAVRSGTAVDGVLGGRVVPIARSGDPADGGGAGRPGGIWGACWVRIDTSVGAGALLVRYFLPVLLVSTVLLSGATFVALRRFVLDPVDDLGRASARLAGGDLAARARARATDDELGRLVASFNAMAERLQNFNAELAQEVARATAQARAAENAAMTQRRLAAMGELAAGIAHEINNPLGGLINAAEALRREDLPAQRRAQYHELLKAGLERMGATVGQLLRFTPREKRASSVSLGACARDAAALVRPRARRQGVEVVLAAGGLEASSESLPPELELSLDALPTVRGEAHELAQALLNLLVNSLDALEQKGRGGRIRIALRARDSRLEVRVEDDGPGVAPELLARISDLFFTTKEPGKGTGLGLAIVHNAVAGCGGEVRFETRPGQGFAVILELPCEGAAGPGGA